MPQDPIAGRAGGWAALATAAPATRKPRGKEPGGGDEAHLWSYEGTVAALEFSQPSLSRRGTGTWQPRSGGPNLRAEGRGGAAAPGPPGRQSFRSGLEDRPGTASKGWGTPAEPSRATTGGPTLLEGRRESGTKRGALFTKEEIGPAKGALPAGDAKPVGGRPRFFPTRQKGPAPPPLPMPGRPAGGAGGQPCLAEGEEGPLLPAHHHQPRSNQQREEGESPPTPG